MFCSRFLHDLDLQGVRTNFLNDKHSYLLFNLSANCSYISMLAIGRN